jgi:hypothetical protein
MHKYPPKDEKNNPNTESDVFAGLVFDKTRQLYLPNSEIKQKETQSEKPGNNRHFPFHVNVRRDTVVFLVSIGTLILVGTAAFFTGRQWQSSDRSATAAENALGDERKNFVRDQRPYLAAVPQGAFPNPINPTDPSIGLLFEERKGKHAIAVNVVLSDIGRTPPVDVDTTDTAYIIDEPNAAKIAAQSFVPRFRNTRTLVTSGPNSGIVPHSETRIFTATEWANLTAANHLLSVYVIGAVQYRDLFSPRSDPVYETDYCYQVSIAGLPFGNCPWDTGFHGQMR